MNFSCCISNLLSNVAKARNVLVTIGIKGHLKFKFRQLRIIRESNFVSNTSEPSKYQKVWFQKISQFLGLRRDRRKHFI